ncbi:MAG: hypothetical protein AAGA56_15220, partial [Myxococcota bacterium]
ETQGLERIMKFVPWMATMFAASSLFAACTVTTDNDDDDSITFNDDDNGTGTPTNTNTGSTDTGAGGGDATTGNLNPPTSVPEVNAAACDACINSDCNAAPDTGNCVTEFDACIDDDGCFTLNDCLGACPAEDMTCEDTCFDAASDPSVNALFDLLTCSVCTSCSTSCDGMNQALCDDVMPLGTTCE